MAFLATSTGRSVRIYKLNDFSWLQTTPSRSNLLILGHCEYSVCRDSEELMKEQSRPRCFSEVEVFLSNSHRGISLGNYSFWSFCIHQSQNHLWIHRATHKVEETVFCFRKKRLQGSQVISKDLHHKLCLSFTKSYTSSIADMSRS